MKISTLLKILLFCCCLQTACANESKESIGHIAEKSDVKFGFAVSYDSLKNNNEYRNIVKRNATTIVPENELKWRRVQPDKNQYNFQKSDYIVNYAVINNLQARGHTLVWHNGIPQYILDEKDSVKVEKLLRDHVTTVVTRYKGKIKSWDVINEVIHIPDNQKNGLRNSYWYQILGEKYIDIAFDAAHKADPNAELVYNEWGTEYNKDYSIAKRKAVINLIERLKARNVLITGFGIQAHLSTNGANFIGNDLSDFIKKLQNLGLNVYITELDVKESESTAKNLKNYSVAEAYDKFLNYALKSGAIDSVLVWGVIDKTKKSNETPFYLFDKSTGCNKSCNAVKKSFENLNK